MFLKSDFMFQKSHVFGIILIFFTVVVLKFFVVGLNLLYFFLELQNLILKVAGSLSFHFKRNRLGDSFFNFFELSNLVVNLVLSDNCFIFDCLKKVLNFRDKAVNLFLLFHFVLVYGFFKALIKIQEHKIVSGLVQEFQSFILGLLEKSCDLLKLVLKSDVLQIRAVSVGVQVEKEGQLIGTGRTINVSVDFFEDLFFEFIFFWYFGVVFL